MTLRKMINTKTGMVSVFDQLVLNERDWYKEYLDDEAKEPSVEVEDSAPAEEKKRKSLKQALQEKAQELEAVDTKGE